MAAFDYVGLRRIRRQTDRRTPTRDRLPLMAAGANRSRFFLDGLLQAR